MKAKNTLKGQALRTYNKVMNAMAEDNDASMLHTFAALTQQAKSIALQSGKFSNAYVCGELKGMTAEEAAKDLTARAAACVTCKVRNIDMIIATAFLAEYISRQRKEIETPNTTTPTTSDTMNTETKTMNEQTKQYFRNVYGSYENLCEQANERLATLRAELQEYHDNHSKGGAYRKRNMQYLQEDIKKLEQQKEECKQAFEDDTTTTITVSITEDGNKCDYTANGKVLASITYRKEFDKYDVNTPSVGYMTDNVTEAHKACESGINWLLNTSAVFDYSAVERYNTVNYPETV